MLCLLVPFLSCPSAEEGRPTAVKRKAEFRPRLKSGPGIHEVPPGLGWRGTVGSRPATIRLVPPATLEQKGAVYLYCTARFGFPDACVAQLAEARDLGSRQWRFESSHKQTRRFHCIANGVFSPGRAESARFLPGFSWLAAFFVPRGAQRTAGIESRDFRECMKMALARSASLAR